MRSGDIWLDDDGNDYLEPTFEYAGHDVWYWSSRSYKSYIGSSHNLRFESTSVSPSDDYDRFYAFSLRCLSTVLDR